MATNPRYQKPSKTLTPPRANAVAEAIALEIVPVDAVASELERAWGVGRLPALVSVETLKRFRAARSMWATAIVGSDLAEVRKLAPMMVRAWRALAVEATAAGHGHLNPEVWEAVRPDGIVLALVRDGFDAASIQRDGRAMEVWTMQEVANMAAHYSQSIGVVKLAFPGARATRTRYHDELFAEDWSNDSGFVAITEGDMV